MKKRHANKKELSKGIIDKLAEALFKRMNKKGNDDPAFVDTYEGTLALILPRPDWFLDYETMFAQTAAVIDKMIHSSKEEEPQAKLTGVSINIGQTIANMRNNANDEVHLRIGDIFISAFFEVGLIRLIQPYASMIEDPTTGKKIKIGDKTWYVKWTPAGKDQKDNYIFTQTNTLRDTASYPPALTSTMLREYAGRRSVVIKRSRQKTPIDTSTIFVKALDKVQQQGWQVNVPVLTTVQNNPSLFKTKGNKEAMASEEIAYNNITSKAFAAAKLGTFYQSWDADYRGRIYTMEPFFSFQGQDMARGLYLFDEGKEMTDDGWYWLYVHTACCFNANYELHSTPEWMPKETRDKYDTYLIDNDLDTISVDKMALDDRASWTEFHIQYIMELGKNVELWTKDNEPLADSPVMFLAACVELHRLIECPGALTHLPVSIDGSNNGWQHLVAIARDDTSAHLVGMSTDTIPADFYLETGKKMLELLDTSTTSKDIVLSSKVKKMPMKHIRKGISKRGSMTKAYSAGAGAIAENMWEDCRKERYDSKYDITEEDCRIASRYLVHAIKHVCPGPLDTMQYFIDMAQYELGHYIYLDENDNDITPDRSKKVQRRTELIRLDIPANNKSKSEKERERIPRQLDEDELKELNTITKVLTTYRRVLNGGNGNHSLTWTTPSGFKVVSEHFIKYAKTVTGTIDNITTDRNGNYVSRIAHALRVNTTHPSVRETVSAVSPNIVHSYDSAHLSCVVAEWDRSIGVIHDSFSTHACDIPSLLSLVKTTFRNIYEDHDVFMELKDQLVTDKQEEFDKVPPSFGQLDFDDVENSDFFFA